MRKADCPFKINEIVAMEPCFYDNEASYEYGVPQ